MEIDSWEKLNLSSGVLSAIEELGFRTLTPVQASCIPLFLSRGKDVSVEAVTGSGKTLAFLIPLFEILQRNGPFRKHDVAAIIISPTRELASQTSEVVDLFLRHIPQYSSILLIGGEPVSTDIANMKENGVNIIIATPGRLADIFNHDKDLKLASCVKALEILILDEADKLLDMGFETTINTILSYLPKQRQTGLFSATQTKFVEDLLRAGLRNPISITVKEKGDVDNSKRTPSSLSNFYMVCEPDKKLSILLWFLMSQTGKYMVFFSTCASVDYFASVLSVLIKHMQVMSIHGKIKKKRHKIFSEFKKSDNSIMLCTDVMARGVDIPDVNWVIQFDPPSSASSFVHRCGRTARIGKTGNALVMLLPNEEAFVNFLDVNQKVTLKKMDTPCVDDISPKIRKMATRNREIYEKGLRAFVSNIRFYTKHECNLLFRVKDLDLGKLANGYALLKLPKMPELKNKDLSDFISTEALFDKIPYLDKYREKQRIVKLKEYQDSAQLRKKNMSTKKESWSKAKNVETKRKLIKKEKKRKAKFDAADLDELARDARLLKKLKQRKITEKEFESKFAPELKD